MPKPITRKLVRSRMKGTIPLAEIRRVVEIISSRSQEREAKAGAKQRSRRKLPLAS